MKRILVFSLAYYPHHVSGAEAAIKEITDRIPREDIAFDVITLRFEKTAPLVETIGNVRIYRVVAGSGYIAKLLFPFLAAICAVRLNRKMHYDAFWGMMTYMLLPIVIARGLGLRRPYALTLQDGDSYEKVFGRPHILPFLPLLNFGFRHATVIQAISGSLASWPKKRGSRMPVVIVRNGANPRDMKDDIPQAKVEELKKKLDKKPGDIFLINTARLVHQKAQDDVIRALPLLPPNIHFVIVGGGESEAALRVLANELHVENRVLFTGQVDRDTAALYRKTADIFVSPSRSEGLGNAMLSAMASRLPVVATQEGGLADFIFDTKRNPDKPTTAWAVDKNNPEQIARAVEDILSNPEKTKEVTEAARRMVVEKYDWDTIAKEMREKIFSKLL